MNVRLLDIAHARSGDKGDTANVGLITLKPAWYSVLDKYVTRERVAAHHVRDLVREHRRELVLVLRGEDQALASGVLTRLFIDFDGEVPEFFQPGEVPVVPFTNHGGRGHQMQNDFAVPGGMFDRAGIDLGWETFSW